MKIRALIVDDEPLGRRGILRFLKNDPDVEVVAQCGDGQSAVGAILGSNPDLVFLDVQMPEMDGFEVIRRVGPQKMPVTVFVTAYDRYAVRAFDANAIDYLLKPVGQARFERALARAKERMAESSREDVAERILATLDHPGVYKDEVLPSVQEAIQKVEDRTGYQDIKNSVTIASKPITNRSTR